MKIGEDELRSIRNQLTAITGKKKAAKKQVTPAPQRMLPAKVKGKAVVQEPSKKAVVPERIVAVKKAAVPDRAKKVVVPEPSKKAAVPDRAKKVVVPERSKKAAVPDRIFSVKKVVVPEPSKKAAVPDRAKKVVVPEPSKKAAISDRAKKVVAPERVVGVPERTNKGRPIIFARKKSTKLFEAPRNRRMNERNGPKQRGDKKYRSGKKQHRRRQERNGTRND